MLNGGLWRVCFYDVANLLKMERETGFEPATSSLGMWALIENKEHSVYGDYPHLMKPQEKRYSLLFVA